MTRDDHNIPWNDARDRELVKVYKESILEEKSVRDAQERTAKRIGRTVPAVDSRLCTLRWKGWDV